jgi:hypothetical protein
MIEGGWAIVAPIPSRDEVDPGPDEEANAVLAVGSS